MFRILSLLVLALVVTQSPRAAAVENRPKFQEGFYLSLGVGNGSVSGTRAIEMVVPNECSSVSANQTFLWVEGKVGCVIAPGDPADKGEFFGEVVRTDYGSGAGVQLRMGYTIRGFVTPELMISGHGDLGTMDEGMVHAGMRLRYHALQHWRPGIDRVWDVGLYYGYGFSLGG